MSENRRGIGQDNAEWDLNLLADQMAEGPASDYYHAAWAELCRRQAEWQRQAALAQANSAKYLFWMLTLVLVSIVFDALFEFLAWRFQYGG